MDRLAALEAFVRCRRDAVVFGGGAKAAQSPNPPSAGRSARWRPSSACACSTARRARSALTEAGRGYFERAARILADLDEADLRGQRAQSAPRGRLRLSAPMSFGFLHLAPALPDFLGALSRGVGGHRAERPVRRSRRGGFRRRGAHRRTGRFEPDRPPPGAGPPRDLRQPRLFPGARRRPRPRRSRSVTSASPTAISPLRSEWRFATRDGTTLDGRGQGPSQRQQRRRAPRRRAERDWASRNLPTFIVGAELQSGALATVLDEYVAQDLSLSAVYPQSRHLSPKVRAFVDFLADRFGPRPYWDLVE